MNKSRILTIIFLGLLSLGILPGSSIRADLAPLQQPVATGPAITLWAASGATLEFVTQNGVAVDGVPPETRRVPHLVLRRNGALTDPAERTLLVEVAGLEVPPPGVTVTLSVETQRSDPDLADTVSSRIRSP